jgi:hypothetical protein
VTGGEAPEVKGCDALMELCEAHPIKLLGDRGYDANGIRHDLYASAAMIRYRIYSRLLS